MAWRIVFDGSQVVSDELTVGELEAVEKAAGAPWSLLNPLKSVQQAKAFLGVLMVRSGLTDEQMTERVGRLTLGDIKEAFQYVPDDPAVAVDGQGDGDGQDLGRPVPITRGSSSGRSGRTVGTRRRPVGSGSGT